MRALVYHGPGQKAWEEVPEPRRRARSTAGQDAGQFVTHRFSMDDFEKAYEVFGDPVASGALKVLLTREEDEDL